MTGPPFVFDPSATYPDQNVQAWAQYYAQGGTDPTGSVYFISVPGITDAPSPQSGAAHLAEGQQQQPHHQHQQPQQQQQQQYQQAAMASATSLSGSESAPSPGGMINTQGHHQRQNSLPNPYGPLSATASEEHGPASAGPGGSGVSAHAPWQATLPGQFAQMRVGEA
jgi:signal transducing adaptor molecule